MYITILCCPIQIVIYLKNTNSSYLGNIKSSSKCFEKEQMNEISIDEF